MTATAAIPAPRRAGGVLRRGRRSGVPGAARHDRRQPRGGRRAERLRRHVGRRGDLDHHDLRRRVRGAAWRPRGGSRTWSAGARCCSPASAPSPCCRWPCALAPSLGVLLAARALQGAAAAAMIPASLAVVLADTPPERRAAAIGAWSAAGALAAAAGPGDRRRARRHGRLARAVPDQRPGRVRDRRSARARCPSGGAGGRLPGRGRHGAARPRHRRRGARHRAGPDWGWGDPRRWLLAGAVLAGGRRAVALVPPRRARRSRRRLWRSRRFAAANLASLLYGAALFPWMLVGVLFLIGDLGLHAARGRSGDDAGRDRGRGRGAAGRAGRRAPRRRRR